MPKGESRSPATKRLNDVHDIRIIDVAVMSKVTPAAVSRWLSGDRPHPPSLSTTLERLVDAEEARKILSLIPAQEGRSQN